MNRCSELETDYFVISVVIHWQSWATVEQQRRFVSQLWSSELIHSRTLNSNDMLGLGIICKWWRVKITRHLTYAFRAFHSNFQLLFNVVLIQFNSWFLQTIFPRTCLKKLLKITQANFSNIGVIQVAKKGRFFKFFFSIATLACY